MKKNVDYDDEEEFEEESFIVSFYRNNKILVWIFLIIIAFILILKFVPMGNKTVNPTEEDIKIVIEPSDNVQVGKGNSFKLTANINVSDATIIWSSSDENIATVSDGRVIGVNYGKATITASYIDKNNNKYTATKDIEVIEGDPNIPLESIKFENGDLYMPLNKEFSLQLTYTPTNALITDKVFTSSDESIVTVTNDGIVKSIGEGYARIIVTVNGKYKSTLDVYVSSKYSKAEIVVSPTTISFDNSSRKIKVGTSEELKYHISPSNADTTKLTWESSNPSVATVDATGKVTAKSEGKTVVTVKSANNRKDEITIEVYNDIIDVSKIDLTVDSINMEAGKTEIITPIVSPDNASNKGLNYVSSDLNIVTVTPSVDGTSVTLSAIKKGTAIVTISSGSIEKKLTVNVTGEGNNSEADEGDPNLPTTIKVRSDKNNLAKTYEAVKKIPVAGEANVTIKLRDGVGKVKYCINKYGSTLCKPNIELNYSDTVTIPSGGIYVLRIIKYDYSGNEISSTSENYVDGVLNYYINTESTGNSYSINGAYTNLTSAVASTVKKGSKVTLKVNGTDGYIKACATVSNTACTPSLKITSSYSFTLNASGTWHIIVNEYDKNNNQIGNSKVYYAVVEEEDGTVVIEGNSAQIKVSELRVYNDSTYGKYLSLVVESDQSFFNTRFCYTIVNKNATGTCNLDLTSSSVAYHTGGSIIRLKDENKTYYATVNSTKKYTFNFYIDGLDKLYTNNDTSRDIIFEFAVKSSGGFTKTAKVRMNMTGRNGNDSSWKSTFIK